MSNYQPQRQRMSSEQVDVDTPARIWESSNQQSMIPKLVQVFLNRDNVIWIIQQIEKRLTEYAQQPVRLEVSLELVASIAHLATEKQTLPPSQQMLHLMNQSIIEKEYNVQRISLNHKARHHKYFVEKEARFKVQPRPRMENEGAKAEVFTDKQILSHPVSRHFSDFQSFVRQK